MFNRLTLFNELRNPLFQGRISQVQVDSVNGILDECQKQGVTNLDMIAYMIGTGWGECRLRPVREGFKKTDKEARAFIRRQYRKSGGKRYKYVKIVNDHMYYGRGLVQLTHDFNYELWGILHNPDKALEPAFAAKVLVVGMLEGSYNGRRKGLAYYLDRPEPDWENARRTVNIRDRWQDFERYAQVVKKALVAAQRAYDDTKVEVNEVTKEDRITTDKPFWQSTTILSTIGGAATSVFGTLMGLAEKQPIVATVIILAALGFAAWVIKERRKYAREEGI